MNRFTNSAAIILMLTMLAACTISKDIEKLVPVLPEKFRNASRENEASIAGIPWKQFFTDASLHRLIGKAIVNNYDMQLALNRIEATQLVLKQTKWLYLPDAALQVTASSNRLSNNSLNGLSAKQFLATSHVEDYSANIVLSWEADIWGK